MSNSYTCDASSECCLCGKQFDGLGHSALPCAEGRCCDECNSTVLLTLEAVVRQIECSRPEQQPIQI